MMRELGVEEGAASKRLKGIHCLIYNGNLIRLTSNPHRAHW